eukprot:CAMPEP_0206465846 /NCGR_PEP_ID=MMETSP0324_2-20121206/28085_1 /ASSEMBLY_ACC=CAM_ASM_000836 /TAXON_ID=2866 /ORGANISM="Crypthecodinium cohnii, Strain Seligo" /LENGTH=34 /DNA_ID= /DNA_START= /DNA_END= /DNA_ORIENTATION=
MGERKKKAEQVVPARTQKFLNSGLIVVVILTALG